MKRKIDLTNYARKRLKEKDKQSKPGPLLTISRAYGCPAKILASQLVKELNKTEISKWSWISKEILLDSAKELGLPPSELRYFFNYNEQGVLDGMLSTLAKFYVTDRKIFLAIEKVIYQMGVKGHVIIVGRGGAAMCRNIPDSLHIRLFAPKDWRIKHVMESQKLTSKAATLLINDHDQKREKFMAHFNQNKDNESIFDLKYNCASFARKDIVTSIITFMKDKKLI